MECSEIFALFLYPLKEGEEKINENDEEEPVRGHKPWFGGPFYPADSTEQDQIMMENVSSFDTKNKTKKKRTFGFLTRRWRSNRLSLSKTSQSFFKSRFENRNLGFRLICLNIRKW